MRRFSADTKSRRTLFAETNRGMSAVWCELVLLIQSLSNELHSRVQVRDSSEVGEHESSTDRSAHKE